MAGGDQEDIATVIDTAMVQDIDMATIAATITDIAMATEQVMLQENARPMQIMYIATGQMG